jgi:MOSC domain-containing protein YiiM
MSKILSLNIGGPEQMHWDGHQVLSSMLKRPTAGPLIVHIDHIEGNSFANPKSHGTSTSILYAYAMPAALDFVRRLGMDHYEPGAAGETVTLDELDETDVSVGDIFEFGEVVAQATFPRIPCGKVDFRMQHKNGRQAMVDCGRSGVYFQILKPGRIHHSDHVRRSERSKQPFLISRLYELVTKNLRPTSAELEVAKSNPAFLQKQLARWEATEPGAPK